MVPALGTPAADLVVMSAGHDRVDVVVIGAGLSGLVCARELAAAGATVRVVEARDRVGGRTFSREVGGEVADLGGEWLAPTQPLVLGLARELGVSTTPQYRTGTAVLASAPHLMVSASCWK